MKKYFTGLLAAVIAISLSAFTNPDAIKKSSGTELFWYHVSGTQTVGSKINSSVLDKDAAMLQITECDDQDEEFCLYGSTNPSLVNFDFGDTPPEDQVIRYNLQ